MRRLLLLRHAKATGVALSESSASPNGGDHNRDLDDRGERNVAALGDKMRRLGLQPDLVLVSSALRTRRTWELLGLQDGATHVQVADRLYLAEDAELLAAIREASDRFGTILLVGHNPGLHTLALHLAGQDAPAGLRGGLPTCTLVAFSVDGGWSALDPGRVHATQVIGP